MEGGDRPWGLDTLKAVEGSVPSRFIGPGDVYCSRIPHLVTTILGSCVAVCLFDPAVGIGGMNHFVLPFHPSGEAPSTRHGDYATATLIRRLGNLGADPERLRAKVFGGSVMLMGGKNGVPSPLSVGARNVALTRGLLAERGIPIERERVLETSGLMIKMLTSTGDVWVRKVGTASFAHVVPRVEATS